MPIFNLECPECGEQIRKVLPEFKDVPCPKCQTVLVRNGEGPSSRVVEIRDNGYMPKKVEQLANINELIKERK